MRVCDYRCLRDSIEEVVHKRQRPDLSLYLFQWSKLLVHIFRSSARFTNPRGVAVDASSGTLVIADSSNHALRRIFLENLTIDASTVAGVMGSSGSTGNGGLASLAKLNNPGAVASDGYGGWLLVSFL